jgi:hypothetical protein
MAFTNTGTYWHVVCDDCGHSLLDALGTAQYNPEVAKTIAYAFDWHVGDRVTCNICRLITLTTP